MTQSYRYTYEEPEHVADERPVKVAWHKVNDETIDRYKRRIDELIPNMIMSSDTLFCNNVLCECGNHRSDIDDVCKQFIDVLLRAGRETLPQCNHKDRGIPYWNDEVESVRETAMFWHWLWVDSDRPRHGHEAAIMRKTRASYHYAVRHIKRRERELRESKMAESVSTNKQRDIWVETKKMLSGKKPSINSVDGACNPEDISEVFASKYETLFQGTPTDPVELQSLYQTIKSGVTADEQSYSSVNVNDVLDALKDIKLGKHDGKYSLTSDHVVNSSRRFLVILSILMASMLVHGYNAADLLSSTIISIPKDARGDMSRSDNYRGIALCNSICKLFDIILMKKCSDVLCTSDQQFAFKANHSTTLCTGILMETATHFVNNNSCVYSCFLDASKAFDKVHYGKLFNLMLKRGVPSVIVRFIIDGYIRQRMCAQWERHTSRSFHVCNGVKQGAVISPILFAVYCDELIAKLARSGYGCRVSQHFVGALSYADDITLLSPSLQGLQYMVNICEEYGKEFHVTFNDKQTTGMVFGASNGNCKAIQVNGNNVDWVTNAKHLGNVVDNKLSYLKDINAKKVIVLRVLTGLWATSEAKCLLNFIFDYFNHIAALIMAQFYGHYTIEVLTIFA